MEYREPSRLGRREQRRIEANVENDLERWLEVLTLYPDPPVPRWQAPALEPMEIGSLGAVDRLAEALREHWKLGTNPIPDLVATLESRGVLVIMTDGPMDGMTARVDGRPVIVVSREVPGDRQRFTLVHELGHRLLGGRLALDIDEEKACDRFAGVVLLPAEEMRAHLGVSRCSLVRELYLLKHEFGLSMMGCLMRAHQAGIIGEVERQRLIRIFSTRGWRKQEPGKPYPQEHSVLFEHLVYRAFAEGWIGESKAAELLGLRLVDFQQQRTLGQVDGVAHQ